MPKFDPDWGLVYVYDRNDYVYRVIKKPEPILGQDPEVVYVREGCTILCDGRWWYWELEEPEEYNAWKAEHEYMDVTDNNKLTPDYIFSTRINKGKGTVGHPAPRFVARTDNNWIDSNPLVVPNHVDSTMLDDLILAHLMLSEHLQDGLPDPATVVAK